MGSEVIGERSIKKLNKTWQLPTLRSLPIECFLPKACCIAFCLLIGPRHANHIQSKSSTWLSIQIWVCSQKRKQTEQQQTNRILANLQVKGTKVPVHGILQAAHAHLQHADRKIHQYNNSIRFSKDKSDTSKVSIKNPKFWVYSTCVIQQGTIYMILYKWRSLLRKFSQTTDSAFDPLQLHIWACKCASKMIHSKSFDRNLNWTVYLVSFKW